MFQHKKSRKMMYCLDDARCRMFLVHIVLFMGRLIGMWCRDVTVFLYNVATPTAYSYNTGMPWKFLEKSVVEFGIILNLLWHHMEWWWYVHTVMVCSPERKFIPHQESSRQYICHCSAWHTLNGFCILWIFPLKKIRCYDGPPQTLKRAIGWYKALPISVFMRQSL